jgi:hypothetical protein
MSLVLKLPMENGVFEEGKYDDQPFKFLGYDR